MRILFSTDEEEPKNRLRRWKETVFERLVPIDLTPIGDRPFQGTLEAGDVGPLQMTRITQGAMRAVATPDTIRRHGKRDSVNVAIALRGKIATCQDDRSSIQRPGELVVLDRRPAVIESGPDGRAIFVEVPRERLENALGSTRRYTALTIGSDQVSTPLVTTFFQGLTQTTERLTEDTAARMSTAGIDLLISCIAERLAQDVPKNLHSEIIVRRSVSYIEKNFDDAMLTPSDVAMSVGVSLRYLQELFRENGYNIAESIWQYRLEVAARRLADSGFGHMSIGSLAYGCGFSDHSHFCRRFKERFGLPPRDYRLRSAGGANRHRAAQSVRVISHIDRKIG